MPEKALGYKEAAQFIGVSVMTLRRWVSSRYNRVPAHKLGTAGKAPVRFFSSELEAWVKAHDEAGNVRTSADKIMQILSSPVNENIPDRWTREELDQMCKDDELTPEEHAEIDAARKKRKSGK